MCLSRRRVRENKPIAIFDGSCPSNGVFFFSLVLFLFFLPATKRKEMNVTNNIIVLLSRLFVPFLWPQRNGTQRNSPTCFYAITYLFVFHIGRSNSRFYGYFYVSKIAQTVSSLSEILQLWITPKRSDFFLKFFK